MKTILQRLAVCFVLCLFSALANAQCTVNLATGGTQCVGPLSVITGSPSQSPTTAIVFLSATDALPCPKGATGSPSVCFDANDNLTVDKGLGPTVLGEQGAPGVNGTNGTNGKDGAPGQAATISIGTVTTLPAGSQATVTNFGSSTSAIFEFGIPQGATGPAGPAGKMPSSCSVTMTWSNNQKTKGTATFSNCK